jgi:hypothetical protein
MEFDENIVLPENLVIDLDRLLSDQLTSFESQAMRFISKATPTERLKFLQLVDDHYRAHNIYERLQRLMQLPEDEWTAEHINEYEDCDKQHIIGMTAAERKKKLRNYYLMSYLFNRFDW